MKQTWRPIATALTMGLIASMMSVAFTTTAASPAQAADTASTAPANPRHTGGVRTFRSVYRIIGEWTYQHGWVFDHVPVGAVRLQFRAKGSSRWRTVDADGTSPGRFDLRHRVRKPGRHRLVYTGGMYQGLRIPRDQLDVGWMPVKRKITVRLKKRWFGVAGRVTPKYKRKPVFLVKVRGPKANKGRKVKRVRTNRRGRYFVKLPKRRQVAYYRLMAPRKGDYVRGYSDRIVKVPRRSGRPVQGGNPLADVAQLSITADAALTEVTVKSFG